MCADTTWRACATQVSVVLQNNVLFSGTIYDNLRWGDKNATDEQCREACHLACADEFIERFPEKYNTRIERGGTNRLRRPEAAPVYRPRAAQEAEGADSG
ncbi:MAG: hypothetical protein ACLUHE_15740 [Christensenellales bacterium]